MDRRTRLDLSELAARLMAESGVTWLDARVKAARRLGIPPGSASQVDEAEVLAALRIHQNLFMPEQVEQLRHLQEAALQAMCLLSDFDPLLVGAVADGLVTTQTPIELVVHADSEKEVEHFLLNAGIGYEVVSPHRKDAIQYRCGATEPVVLITANIRRGKSRARHSGAESKVLDIRALEQVLAAPR